MARTRLLYAWAVQVCFTVLGLTSNKMLMVRSSRHTLSLLVRDFNRRSWWLRELWPQLRMRLMGDRTLLSFSTNVGWSICVDAGLDYPGVGPEHAFYKDSGRATYVAVPDDQALEVCMGQQQPPQMSSSSTSSSTRLLLLANCQYKCTCDFALSSRGSRCCASTRVSSQPWSLPMLFTRRWRSPGVYPRTRSSCAALVVVVTRI